MAQTQGPRGVCAPAGSRGAPSAETSQQRARRAGARAIPPAATGWQHVSAAAQTLLLGAEAQKPWTRWGVQAGLRAHGGGGVGVQGAAEIAPLTECSLGRTPCPASPVTADTSSWGRGRDAPVLQASWTAAPPCVFLGESSWAGQGHCTVLSPTVPQSHPEPRRARGPRAFLSLLTLPGAPAASPRPSPASSARTAPGQSQQHRSERQGALGCSCSCRRGNPQAQV